MESEVSRFHRWRIGVAAAQKEEAAWPSIQRCSAELCRPSKEPAQWGGARGTSELQRHPGQAGAERQEGECGSRKSSTVDSLKGRKGREK